MTNVARALRRAGFTDLHVVEAQAIPDGNFPNVAGQIPNPEQPAALRECLDLGRQVGADLVLASDPDADRIGAAVPDAQTGAWVPLNGNQIAALLAHYVVSKRAKSGPAAASRRSDGRRDTSYVVKTLVTTDLISRIAES